jgi:hypothetical protein
MDAITHESDPPQNGNSERIPPALDEPGICRSGPRMAVDPLMAPRR